MENILNLLAKHAQQSAHWTLGILRHFQAFFWLRVFSAPKQSPRPPQLPVNVNRWALASIILVSLANTKDALKIAGEQNMKQHKQ